jgi:hypothetical protein
MGRVTRVVLWIILIVGAGLGTSCGGGRGPTDQTAVIPTTTTTTTTTTTLAPSPVPTAPPAPTPVPGGGMAACPGTRPSVSCGLATGRCDDSTYTCSENRSGTCSSHGGLGCVYCPGPIC